MRIRPRTPEDLPACVAALALVQAVDRYPVDWPADPAAWLTPSKLTAAWIAEESGTIFGHIALTPAHTEATEGLKTHRHSGATQPTEAQHHAVAAEGPRGYSGQARVTHTAQAHTHTAPAQSQGTQVPSQIAQVQSHGAQAPSHATQVHGLDTHAHSYDALMRSHAEPTQAAETHHRPATSQAAAEVIRLFVTPAARGRGLAARLLTTARTATAGPLSLEVSSEAEAAITLYERLGWRRIGSHRATWLNAAGEPALLHHYLSP
ncbi:GNAT family N-acetyltransferase [Nonomuraea sp. NPDC050328]|uniref:GNAT family N-acetyltransferase n=1 Tax=Nonomuraea sp. NPDC050328 TaxID=3364361 RepID=UPI0037BAA2BB